MWTLQELRNGISKVNQTFEQTVDWDYKQKIIYSIIKARRVML